VVHDLFLTETARYRRRGAARLEFRGKDGTFVNTERRIRSPQGGGHAGAGRGDLRFLIDLSNRSDSRRA